MTDTGVPTRTITHAEFLYAPGERELAVELFSLLGCRVVDRRGVWFTAFVEPSESNYALNAFYASEMSPAQAEFERRVNAAAGRAVEEFAANRRAAPQYSFHCGIRVGDRAALDDLIARVRSAGAKGALEARVAVAGVYEPDEPGALAPGMVQVFVWTDVVSNGLLSLGQLFEIQLHLSEMTGTRR